jgi:thiol:disulfide interchange protein
MSHADGDVVGREGRCCRSGTCDARQRTTVPVYGHHNLNVRDCPSYTEAVCNGIPMVGSTFRFNTDASASRLSEIFAPHLLISNAFITLRILNCLSYFFIIFITLPFVPCVLPSLFVFSSSGHVVA